MSSFAKKPTINRAKLATFQQLIAAGGVFLHGDEEATAEAAQGRPSLISPRGIIAAIGLFTIAGEGDLVATPTEIAQLVEAAAAQAPV